MADGDAQFRVGVEHGYNDEPLYRWQDRRHQERYEAGYLIGRWQRITQAQRQPRPDWGDGWDRLEARFAAKGLVRRN